MRRPVLSLVLPIYNEEEIIPELHARLQDFLAKLKLDTEVLFVNDGSRDRSMELLRGIAAAEPRYKVLSFARNFGHQTAITAGVDYARGQAVVVMDADLQDPPDVVLEMVATWRQGYDVVYGKRRTRHGETAFKLFTAKWFYRIFKAMIPIDVPLDTGDFRLMSRRVVVALRELREAHRFVRGMVAWVGFRQTAVLYDRPGRFAGETKYPLRKMVRFAIDGITSFSVLPLRFATYLGMVISALSVVIAVWALAARFIFHATVEGWAAEVVLVSLLAAVQLLMIGILGEYVGRIYEQVKARPLYVVGDRVNLQRDRDDDDLDDDVVTSQAGGPIAPPVAPAFSSPLPATVHPLAPPLATAFAEPVGGPFPTAAGEPVVPVAPPAVAPAPLPANAPVSHAPPPLPPRTLLGVSAPGSASRPPPPPSTPPRKLR